jgi:hypothetical protein
MREINVKLYKFDELSKEAQEYAIEKWRNSMEWDIESSMITEHFEEVLKEKHLPNEDIEWSLAYCQGDGVAFYGTVYNDDIKIIAKNFLNDEDYKLLEAIHNEDFTVEAKIYRNSYGYRYSHWNTMEVEMNHDDIDNMIYYLHDIEKDYDSEEYTEAYNKINNLINSIEEYLSSYIKDVSRELERDGYAEIEYLQSDESIEETIKCNDYEFTEDGEMHF